MKKVLKPILIVIVIIATIIGGLYAGYTYSNSKKVVTVVPMTTYGMEGYWGDSIQSYGTVTADKSHTIYVDKGTEITAVNYKAGDHVNEGDVLFTVKKDSQDITGKELEVQKAKQAYDADVATLNRLENTTPIPEYISSSPDTRTRIDEDGNEYEVTIGTFYYNAETGELIGHEAVDGEGNVIEKYNEPKGYTPTQLKEKIEDVTSSLKKTDLQYRIAQNELNVMKNTDNTGAIKAAVSGTVSKVQNKDNYNNTQPFMIVAATDDYYISGTIGEFYLDSVHVGDVVSISSFESGLTADATITYISDSASTDTNNFYSGAGNTNSSNYEFRATLAPNSGIEIGSAVDITITPAGQEEGGFYISSYFIRKDASGSYVMKMNDDGVLEKVYVRIGKTLWGEMTEIKEGVTIDDYLAFPYGNGAIEGIKCEVGESIDESNGGLG